MTPVPISNRKSCYLNIEVAKPEETNIFSIEHEAIMVFGEQLSILKEVIFVMRVLTSGPG